LHIWAKR